MLDTAIDFTGPTPEITPQFLKAFDAMVPFDTNPLYALLHEACYSSGGATRWCAQRVQDEHWAKLFDPIVRSCCPPVKLVFAVASGFACCCAPRVPDREPTAVCACFVACACFTAQIAHTCGRSAGSSVWRG